MTNIEDLLLCYCSQFRIYPGLLNGYYVNIPRSTFNIKNINVETHWGGFTCFLRVNNIYTLICTIRCCIENNETTLELKPIYNKIHGIDIPTDSIDEYLNYFTTIDITDLIELQVKVLENL